MTLMLCLSNIDTQKQNTKRDTSNRLSPSTQGIEGGHLQLNGPIKFKFIAGQLKQCSLFLPLNFTNNTQSNQFRVLTFSLTE